MKKLKEKVKAQPNRKQVVAKQNLENAIKECERLGIKVEV